MLIKNDRPPLYITRHSNLAVFRILLECGHSGGLAKAGTVVSSLECRRCGVRRYAVGYHGAEEDGTNA